MSSLLRSPSKPVRAGKSAKISSHRLVLELYPAFEGIVGPRVFSAGSLAAILTDEVRNGDGMLFFSGYASKNPNSWPAWKEEYDQTLRSDALKGARVSYLFPSHDENLTAIHMVKEGKEYHCQGVWAWQAIADNTDAMKAAINTLFSTVMPWSSDEKSLLRDNFTQARGHWQTRYFVTLRPVGDCSKAAPFIKELVAANPWLLVDNDWSFGAPGCALQNEHQVLSKMQKREMDIVLSEAPVSTNLPLGDKVDAAVDKEVAEQAEALPADVRDEVSSESEEDAAQNLINDSTGLLDAFVAAMDSEKATLLREENWELLVVHTQKRQILQQFVDADMQKPIQAQKSDVVGQMLQAPPEELAGILEAVLSVDDPAEPLLTFHGLLDSIGDRLQDKKTALLAQEDFQALVGVKAALSVLDNTVCLWHSRRHAFVAQQ
eukprot:TRINITY_DN10332_c0_g1_i3.p1 TRINITY_DN10332_c0_g1~~TRINITY_DN10332_c0_g1_i3.p1  ORF type:complete len:450 (+),score=81.26 TRINITY_DN10332_c0_g1_i3:52-1350(+)